MDQLQGDTSKVDCQAVREHLLNSLSGDWPRGSGDLCGVDIGGGGRSVKAQVQTNSGVLLRLLWDFCSKLGGVLLFNGRNYQKTPAEMLMEAMMRLTWRTARRKVMGDLTSITFKEAAFEGGLSQNGKVRSI